MLEVQGQAPVPPSDRSGLHPLLIPLAAPAGGVGGAGTAPAPVTCLLRGAGEGASAMPLAVVTMTRGAVSMALAARSIDEFLARALAEEEAALGGPGPAAEAAGAVGAALYAPGALAASGLPSLDAFLVRKARGAAPLPPPPGLQPGTHSGRWLLPPGLESAAPPALLLPPCALVGRHLPRRC